MNLSRIARRVIRGKVLVSAVSGVAALGLVFATDALSASAATGAPTSTGVHLSEKSITPGGGTITVTATPAQDSTCSIAVTPALPSVPGPLSCDGGWPVRFDLAIPGNTTASPILYDVAVTETDQAGDSTVAHAPLTQWAYKVTFTSTPLANDFVSLACPSSTLCLALDSSGGGHLLKTKNGKVKDVAMSPTGHQLSSLACGSPTYCVAADLDGDAAVWGGTGTAFSLTDDVIPAPGTKVFSDCADATDCYLEWTEGPGSAVGGDGTAAVQDFVVRVVAGDGVSLPPVSFTTPGTTTGFACLKGIDPGSSDFGTCIVAGDDASLTQVTGDVVTTTSTTGPALGDVACPSAASCVGNDPTGGIDDVAPLHLASQPIVHRDLAARVASLACPVAWLCVTASDGAVSLAEWGSYDPVHGHQGASPTFVPEGPSAPVVMSAIPGSTTTFVAVSKQKNYVGHVTLIKQ
jgi:hypothetical protein